MTLKSTLAAFWKVRMNAVSRVAGLRALANMNFSKAERLGQSSPEYRRYRMVGEEYAKRARNLLSKADRAWIAAVRKEAGRGVRIEEVSLTQHNIYPEIKPSRKTGIAVQPVAFGYTPDRQKVSLHDLIYIRREEERERIRRARRAVDHTLEVLAKAKEELDEAQKAVTKLGRRPAWQVLTVARAKVKRAKIRLWAAQRAHEKAVQDMGAIGIREKRHARRIRYEPSPLERERREALHAVAIAERDLLAQEKSLRMLLRGNPTIEEVKAQRRAICRARMALNKARARVSK
jgi:hypothetical protein